jgi:hypothetical protein
MEMRSKDEDSLNEEEWDIEERIGDREESEEEEGVTTRNRHRDEG